MHQELGYGLLERVNERALQVELLRGGAKAEIEKRKVHYKVPWSATTIPT